VISADQENDADVLGMLGASAALSLSSIPWDGPIAGVRVGRVESEWIVNPTFEELDFSDMDIVVAGSEDSIVMVEGAALEISEEEFVEVLNVAHPAIKEYEASKPPEGLEEAVGNRAAAQVQTALRIADKAEREAVLSELREEIVAALEEEYGDEVGRVRGIIRDLEKKEMRRQILEERAWAG
jgi:polyribonucleotide nucleotidyltransferase